MSELEEAVEANGYTAAHDAAIRALLTEEQRDHLIATMQMRLPAREAPTFFAAALDQAIGAFAWISALHPKAELGQIRDAATGLGLLAAMMIPTPADPGGRAQ